MFRFSHRVYIFPIVQILIIISQIGLGNATDFNFYTNFRVEKCYAHKHNIYHDCYVGMEITSLNNNNQKFFCKCVFNESAITNRYNGDWAIILTNEKTNTTFIEKIHLFHSTTLTTPLPGNSLIAKVGQYVRIYLNETYNTDKIFCHVYYDRRLLYDLSTLIDNEDVESYGGCGIQMRVKDGYDGQWSIHHEDHVCNRQIVADFTIVIADEKSKFFSPRTVRYSLPELLIGREIVIAAKMNERKLVEIDEVPGEIEQCYAIRKNNKFNFYPKNESYIFKYVGQKKNCSFEIRPIFNHVYGPWEIVTIYRNGGISRTVKNKLFIFERIHKHNTEPVHMLISNSSDIVDVSSTKDDAFVNSTCRLVHTDSGKEYDFNSHSHPTRGIQLYRPSLSQCGASIKISNLRFGYWYLEERSELNIRRSFYHFISIV